MKIQIDNIVIIVDNQRTKIVIMHEPQHRNFTMKLDFNIYNITEHVAALKARNYAEYWFMSDLYNRLPKKGAQLELF